jgi:ACS family hexuronate transporter-like MFS transporter
MAARSEESMNTNPVPKYRQSQAWGITGVLMAMYALNYADKAVLGIIAAPLREDIGLSPSQFGAVGSLFFLTFAIGGFAAPAIGKWPGLKYGLLALALVWSIAMLPLVVSASFATLVASRMLLGLAEGPCSGLLHSAAYTWHPPDSRGVPGALLASSAGLAKILCIPALTYVVVTFSWRAVLIVLAVGTVIWAGLWLRVWRPGPYADHQRPDGAATRKVPLQSVIGTHTFVVGVLTVGTVYALISVVLTWLPSYLEQGLGYSQMTSGVLFGLPSICALVTLLAASTLSDSAMRRGRSERTVRIVCPCLGLAVCSVLLLILPYVHSAAVTIGLFSAAYGLAATALPLFNATIASICPSNHITSAVSTFIALMAIGGLVAPYTAGVVIGASSSELQGYNSVFQVLGFAIGVCALLAIWLINPARDRVLILTRHSRRDA